MQKIRFIFIASGLALGSCSAPPPGSHLHHVGFELAEDLLRGVVGITPLAPAADEVVTDPRFMGTGFIFAETATHYLGMTNRHVWMGEPSPEAAAAPQPLSCAAACWLGVARDSSYSAWQMQKIEPYRGAAGEHIIFPRDQLDIALFQVAKGSIELEPLPLTAELPPEGALIEAVGYPTQITKPGATEAQELLVRSSGILTANADKLITTAQLRRGSSGSPLLILHEGKPTVAGIFHHVVGQTSDHQIEAGNTTAAAVAVDGNYNHSEAEPIQKLVNATNGLPLWQGFAFTALKNPRRAGRLVKHLSAQVKFHAGRAGASHQISVAYDPEVIQLGGLYYNNVPVALLQGFTAPHGAAGTPADSGFTGRFYFTITFDPARPNPQFSYHGQGEVLFSQCHFLSDDSEPPLVTGIACY